MPAQSRTSCTVEERTAEQARSDKIMGILETSLSWAHASLQVPEEQAQGASNAQYNAARRSYVVMLVLSPAIGESALLVKLRGGHPVTAAKPMSQWSAIDWPRQVSIAALLRALPQVFELATCRFRVQ